MYENITLVLALIIHYGFTGTPRRNSPLHAHAKQTGDVSLLLPIVCTTAAGPAKTKRFANHDRRLSVTAIAATRARSWSLEGREDQGR